MGLSLVPSRTNQFVFASLLKFAWVVILHPDISQHKISTCIDLQVPDYMQQHPQAEFE